METAYQSATMTGPAGNLVCLNADVSYLFKYTCMIAHDTIGNTCSCFLGHQYTRKHKHTLLYDYKIMEIKFSHNVILNRENFLNRILFLLSNCMVKVKTYRKFQNPNLGCWNSAIWYFVICSIYWDGSNNIFVHCFRFP